MSIADLNPVLLPLTLLGPLKENTGLITHVTPEEIPQPYRKLLVHDRDMTGTLERHHGESIQLKVLTCERFDNIFFRKVLLMLTESNRPVEYGGIRIFLDHFPEKARTLILEGVQPLGGILNQLVIAYESRPQRFLRFAPESEISQLFGCQQSTPHYGRCNLLFNKAGETMAEIVEILPWQGSEVRS